LTNNTTVVQLGNNVPSFATFIVFGSTAVVADVDDVVAFDVLLLVVDFFFKDGCDDGGGNNCGGDPFNISTASS
jgi:hypothetical protein